MHKHGLGRRFNGPPVVPEPPYTYQKRRTISIDLPTLEGSQDSLKAIGSVLEAVGSGAITPSEGQALASLLETHRRTFEVEELEHRIEALEAQQCGAR